MDEQWHVLRSRPQRRQRDWNDFQPIVQVFTEPPFRDRLVQILVRRRENAHIDLDVPRAADASKLPFLNDA